MIRYNDTALWCRTDSETPIQEILPIADYPLDKIDTFQQSRLNYRASGNFKFSKHICTSAEGSDPSQTNQDISYDTEILNYLSSLNFRDKKDSNGNLRKRDKLRIYYVNRILGWLARRRHKPHAPEPDTVFSPATFVMSPMTSE